ncbi:hypothetical protein GCM10007855_09900 [Aliivibrio sifiae]|uniref:Addiction module toxin RelE n=1 Tax=Aliivibrio sifiae TaxID=566293 RepID=A0ABQ6AH38_9GAMM|nr:hypothetical protein GCM10007855_09900 [Aliivibrio sifiae]
MVKTLNGYVRFVLGGDTVLICMYVLIAHKKTNIVLTKRNHQKEMVVVTRPKVGD